MKKLIPGLLLIFFSLPVSVYAQDSRFSQYFNNPLILNPALAGNGIEHIRLTAIYRNQWAGMGTPFTTQGFAVDKVVNRIGIGAAITRNGAGDASIKTINFVGNLSYHLPLDADKINTLSAGVQVGIVNKSFDPSKMTFDNQFSPDAGYDPTISSGEDFTSTSVTRPDVNAGLMWQRGWLKKEVRFKPFVGISYSHLTQPDEAFILDATEVHIKRTIYAGAGYLLNDKLEIKPSVMLLNQGPSKESTFGTLLNYQLDNKNSVQLGAYHRLHDAVIAYAGYQMNLLFVGMSYDVNTSELSTSGKGNNAFEISLTYSPRSKRKKEPKPVKVEQLRLDPLTKMSMLPIQVQMPEIPDELSYTPITLADSPKTEEVPPVSVVIPEQKEALPVIVELPKAEEAPQVAVVIPEPVAPEITAIPVPIVPEIDKLTDSDEDGITDNIDECPYIKGSASSKGCPDSDSDGIVDMKDECPMESGTIKNMGCPDPTFVPEINNQELVKKFDNILFATGLVKLTTDDIFDIIERAIDIMYADKSTKVIISGHTDSEGNEYQNMILSQARADVVKRYMIEQGIDASRIQTVAYGETMPLENNLSAEGKRLNRRVEINILRK